MKHKYVMVVLFFLILFGLPLASIIVPDRSFSENENRVLAKVPGFSLEQYKDETFMNGMEVYISDHFFQRENWIQLKNQADKWSGKMEIGGTCLLENQMVELWKDDHWDVVRKSLKDIDEFSRKNSQLHTSVILAPTAQGVFMDEMPKGAELKNQAEFIENCYRYLENTNHVNVLPALYENRDAYMYYRTDHHWTSRGAFAAYQVFCKSKGIQPKNQEDFHVEMMSDDFRGTLFSKNLNYDVEADFVEFFIPRNTNIITEVKVEGMETHDGLYYEEFLEEKDKYAAFLGRNQGIVDIYTDGGQEGSLLIIKDSYAHSMVPFLTNHYSHITMIDLRYMNPVSLERLDISVYEDVLFLYNVITFSEEKKFTLLNKLSE